MRHRSPGSRSGPVASPRRPVPPIVQGIEIRGEVAGDVAVRTVEHSLDELAGRNWSRHSVGDNIVVVARRSETICSASAWERLAIRFPELSRHSPSRTMSHPVTPIAAPPIAARRRIPRDLRCSPEIRVLTRQAPRTGRAPAHGDRQFPHPGRRPCRLRLGTAPLSVSAGIVHRRRRPHHPDRRRGRSARPRQRGSTTSSPQLAPTAPDLLAQHGGLHHPGCRRRRDRSRWLRRNVRAHRPARRFQTIFSPAATAMPAPAMLSPFRAKRWRRHHLTSTARASRPAASSSAAARGTTISPAVTARTR